MGGGFYSQDVAREARSSNRDVFAYSGYTEGTGSNARRAIHPILNPKSQIRECANDNAVVVALDVTRSRGDDTKVMYEKLPMLMGQLHMKGYLSGFAISFAAIGDANSDKAPVQVGQFEADNRLDDVISKFWIEEGGGGSGQESYELAAYYYARKTKIDCADKGRKGFFFFVGDEGFYPTVEKKHISKFLGFDENADIDSETIFKELQEKFYVFFIYPGKSFEERKADIDAEIRQRVLAAGGQYENVDIRASLIWNNRNDLDLHVITPSGEHIFYQHKQSNCGGWLDVDMNVRGDSLKPVENVRWSKGSAPKGKYRIFVQNYAFHEQDRSPTEFRVEVEVNGEVKHFDGMISAKGETGGRSDVTVYEFDYDPDKRPVAAEGEKEDDMYTAYSDKVIMKQWASVIPTEHILRIQDPESIIDVLLGVLALMTGKEDLKSFINDMKGREGGAKRLKQTEEALERLAAVGATAVNVDLEDIGGSSGAAGSGDARGKTRRL